ncbi:MAG: inositol monophosphatase [Deltaproteobacteria bacterium]|nr:inositol monophosphatase [Deltaproteobacteria bacterium]
MTTVSKDEFFQFTKELCERVGAYQTQKWGTALNIEHKGEINLVTEVDKHSEKLIVEAIQSRFPDHDILAEEGSGERKDSPYKWIIDPLDGTTNFAHAYPLFAISIALEFEGKILAGAVYVPILKELFQGYAGEGAFLNDKPIQVSQSKTVLDSMVATGFAYNLRETHDNNINHFKNVLLKAGAVRRDGVAAIDLCYVACGRYDAFWELDLFPWDTAAGMVICEEAGGRTSRFDGTKYTVYEREILISNSLIHDEMVSILKPGIPRGPRR